MAHEPTEFTDTDLSAWIDGAWDAPQRARIEALLRENPQAAGRARLMAADRDAVRAHFAGVLDEPVPKVLADQVATGGGERGAGTRRWAQAAMAAGLLIAGGVVGAGLTWQWQGQRVAAAQSMASSSWVQRAALAHAVYTPEQRHPVEVRAQEDHLLRWLSRRSDLPLRLYDLREQGFELMGGRLVPESSARPSAQLMYEDASGRRVTVYLRKPEGNTSTAFRFAREGALNLFYWVDSECGYALVGDLPRERLLALAETIYRQESSEATGAGASTPAR